MGLPWPKKATGIGMVMDVLQIVALATKYMGLGGICNS